ncbi:hydroxyacylglutathione hydrolase [Thiohalomonas denitrificans]|uniref:hydroxyacylglutathione hydrolase n=1 Tax=Thiohalomonas denitrificans TaxID=415747 RepID=UPI0026EC0B34|nr:hydroxyacylglutathione hydrolase [Thiohalomonas denitrificans]
MTGFGSTATIRRMAISIRGIPAFEDNYIWFIGASGSLRVAVVDPGDADPVIEALERDGLELSAILVTHLHGDHTGGIQDLVDRYPAPVYGPPDERITTIDHRVSEGDIIRLGEGLTLQVLDTPGHTCFHACYHGEGFLFSGDTLFTGGCGKLFEGTPQQMHASLEKIAALPDDTLVYCAHEYTLANLAFARIAEPDNPDIRNRQAEAQNLRDQGKPTVPSALGLERMTNPFLRYNNPNLKASAERFAGRPLTPGAEVFTVVRYWKDTLD